MAEFLSTSLHDNGFDRWAAPRWQMVPLRGIRHVLLTGGTGLTVSKTNPNITLVEIDPAERPVEVFVNPNDPTIRLFRLEGLHPGLTKVRATRNGGLVTELDVSVKDRMEVLVSFHFVHDSAGHHTTRVPAEVADWIVRMNAIWQWQANIVVRTRLIQRNVEVAGDLGPAIRTRSHDQSPTDAWFRVIAHRDPGARFNVFLVWELTVVDAEGDAEAAANIDCLCEDNVGENAGIILAHELGHCLGLDDHYIRSRACELMYGHTAQGTFLPKADVQRANRTAAA